MDDPIGDKSSSGFDVVITGATDSNGVVTVDAILTQPGSSCAVLTIQTEFVDLARIPTTPGTVNFDLIQKTSGC